MSYKLLNLENSIRNAFTSIGQWIDKRLTVSQQTDDIESHSCDYYHYKEVIKYKSNNTKKRKCSDKANKSSSRNQTRSRS